jgi:hypothetical protein
MIISEPAAFIIGEVFGHGIAASKRLRFKGRVRRPADPLTSQAYSEGGLVSSTNRSGATATTTVSAIQRRGTPLR